jgi:hypothetical protein
LIFGLATRVGAAVLLALAVASHIRVAALDLNLFWMAFARWLRPAWRRSLFA